MNTAKKLPFLKILLISLVFISAIFLLKVLRENYYPDFSVYYDGAKTLFSGGNPYSAGHKYFAPFNNAPTVFLVFFIFTKLPFLIAGKIFTTVSLLCFSLTIYLLYRIFQLRFFSLSGLFFLILIGNFFPEKFTLGMGQINNVIFLLVTLFIYFYAKKKEYLSGIFLALAIAIKLFPILILFYLVITKKWKILFTSICTLLVVTGLVYIVVQQQVFFYFFQRVLPGLLNAMDKDYYNQSLTGFFLRDFPTGFIFTVIRQSIEGILVILSLFLVWKFDKKAPTNAFLCMSMLITLTLIINSFSWQHHFVWLLIPFLVTFIHIKTNQLSVPYYVILFISFLLVAANIKNPSTVPIFAQSHVLYGALLLYCLEVYMLVYFKKKPQITGIKRIFHKQRTETSNNPPQDKK